MYHQGACQAQQVANGAWRPCPVLTDCVVGLVGIECFLDNAFHEIEHEANLPANVLTMLVSRQTSVIAMPIVKCSFAPGIASGS